MKDYDEILVALRQITRAIDLYSKRLQRDTGLTTSQLLVLQAIDRLDKPTPGAVAREIVLSQATVTNLLDRLQKSDYVERLKIGTDKRTVNLVLTDQGQSILASAPELLQTEFLNRYRSLENWEQQMLAASLGRIATMMNAEDIDASPILTPGEVNPGTT
ncbi:MAG: DNA-binding MarR family transcriptional regulator [Patiriisocius sp.]|jgi:DNA-binding MarR family transcriptional regulator